MKNLHYLLSLFFLLCLNPIFSQTEEKTLKAESGTLTFLGISQPVSSLEEFPIPERFDFERNEEMKDRFYPNAETALPKGPDPVIQKNMGETDMTKGLSVNYDGISGTSYPPDPNGDVGPNHYFQTTNINYQIFDKAGNSLYGPADIRNFWGTSEGVSDPVVLYDDNADRWFVEIFTTTPSGSYNIMMAISTTPDPLGSFYLYTLAGLPNLPDFTKYGVWQDGYYMSANSGSYDVYAFDRSALIAGLPTGYVRFDNAWRPGSGFHCIMPLDNDGAFAPTGTPGQFITINDDAWGGSDELWIYELDVDWTNTSTATFLRTQQITVASFDSNFGPSWDNIYQQGTAQRLDAVPQVLNFRAQYRNFGSHQTIVCNHSVDVDNTDHAGVRWYELRDTGGSWWLYQQSTFAPDAHSRWMGAIAMNAYGDIGLAYSISSGSLYPGLRYTGRHASDPLGTMTFAEASIWDGANSQTYGNRWGDYFSMSVDPSDDQTFWFTGEYHGTNRRTRIAAIDFGVYCAASGGCDEYISNVSFGSINNSSACTNYGDYTAMSTDLALNGSEALTVTNGNPIYNVDECGVWVDWNNDGDFDDAGETKAMSGSPGIGPYTTTIIPPAGATIGLRTMRIRIDYNTTPLPCGTATWGEVEDYTINVTPKLPAIWTGATDNNWHDATNWTTPSVPDATTDVIIPDVVNKCWVYASLAQCNNITIEYGSGFDLRIWDQDLEVYGDMDFYGQLLMDHDDGRIIATKNVTWHAGSRASIQANSIFEVYGDWNFQAGADVTINNGLVGFTGSGSSMIRSYEENCYFNHVVVLKTTPDWASISNLSTADLYIHGDLAIEPGSDMYCYTPESVFIDGNFVCLGSFMAGDGTMVFDGADQLMFWNGTATDELYFNNLIISSSVNTSITNYLTQNIAVNANLVIEQGQLITNSYPLRIRGNWDNQVGPGGFDPGIGRVIFDGGNYHQYCSNEYFHILEVDKPLGGAFRMQGTHVECGSYDWTAGVIDVIPGGGSFTALDLYDDAIYGAYYLNPGGTINLHQDSDPLSYTDLNGELHIFGGIMNVYGGTGPSYWSFAGDAWISMSDGVLDFHDQGIYAWQSATHTLTENITGGTIRTIYGFWANSPSFTPDFGTIEFYSTNDADIFTINGSNLNHVFINKAPKKENTGNKKNANSIPLIDERSGKTMSNGSKSNTISLYDFLDINGNLVIDNGVLNSAGNNIQIAGDWTNNVGPSGFMESTGNVTFDGANGAVIWTGETFANLYLDKTFAGIEALELADGTTVNVLGELFLSNGNLEMNPYSLLKVDGNLFIALEAGLNADDGFNEIEVGGDWTNENTSYNLFEGFTIGGEVVTFNGTLDQHINTNASQEDFTNIIIDKTSGNFRPNDNIRVDGGLQILDGDWFDYTPSLTHYWNWHVLIGVDGNYYPQGTTIFSGTVDQTYTNNGGLAMFRDLIIDKSGILFLNSDMVVSFGNTTNVDAGTLNLNGNWFKGTGDININNGGEIFVDAGSHLSIVEGLYVNNGGLFTALGAPGDSAYIFMDVVGNYAFEVNVGGTISANYATFEDLDDNGVWVKNGAFVDPVNTFNNCSFTDGLYAPWAGRLIINNNQVLSINNIEFKNPDAWNIAKADDQGDITITTTSGNFTGPLYEYDPYDRIHWTDYVHGMWTGNVSSDWFDPMNWGDFIVPGTTTEVVIPAGTPNDPVINNAIANCYTLTIEAGASLEVGNEELNVGYLLDNYGHLIMTNSLAIINSLNIFWHPGSTDNVAAGEFHISLWGWQDGTNASMGTGNTVYVDFGIVQNDADAAFGNLVITPDAFAKGEPKSKGSYPVRVDGYCEMLSGIGWNTSADFIINGYWVIEDGADFHIHTAAEIINHGEFTLDGEILLDGLGSMLVHGMFNFGSSAVLTINNGSFVCDHTLSSGWIDLLGDIKQTTGTLEFPDANISFAGTSTISGGTIVAGRSVHADLAGAFLPTGGKLELAGSSAGHYVQIRNGNSLYELHVSRSSPIGVHPGSPLVVQSDLIINSELMAQGNPVSVLGDLAINSGGLLKLDEGATLEMANNRWINVNNGGTLEAIGLPGNEAILSNITGYYHMIIDNGGTISAENAIFEYMGIDGLQISNGAMVNLTYSFNACIFQNGILGGQLMSIYSTQDFTVDNAIFPSNTWSGTYNVYKNSTPGNVTFINATGDFAGETYEYDPYNHVHWGVPEVRLELKVFLEGPFNGTSMDTYLNPMLPLDHPFDPPLPYFGNPMPDWYYLAGGSVGFIPDPGVVDWVLVQLRDATSPGAALPATSIATTPAFLMEDGTIIAMDGSPQLTFVVTPTNELYLVVWHRNHLGVISAYPLTESGGIYSYDFSSDPSHTYGGASAQVQLSVSPVIWGMMAGDGNGTGDISITDKNNVWSIQTGTEGYLESDYNLNINVNNQDKNDFWSKNIGQVTYIPE